MTARGSSESRAVAIAVLSTIVVLVAIVVVVTQSPGWDEFKAYFLNWGYYRTRSRRSRGRSSST